LLQRYFTVRTVTDRMHFALPFFTTEKNFA
jgi:hypothetical protein